MQGNSAIIFSPYPIHKGGSEKKSKYLGKVSKNNLENVLWPPVIPLTPRFSVDGSLTVGISPFGKSLMLNRDATHLPKVLGPCWGWRVGHQMVEITFQM